MGCFSWLDCKTGKGIRIGERAYLLVPEEFKDTYGSHIEETDYDGYGRFGGYDVYDLVVIWNAAYMSEANLREAPKPENYGGLWEYEKDRLREEGKSEAEIKAADNEARMEHCRNALNERARTIQIMNEFKAGKSVDEMEAQYGHDFLRILGIKIACDDDQNKRLKYPIKITRNENAVYEDCKYSKGDPKQGCF